MFAFALWDRHKCVLTLARDRMGEKPLYYGWVAQESGHAFVFGSELKALRAFQNFANPVCRQALAQYMRFFYVPAPRSIYKNIYNSNQVVLLVITHAPPATPPAQPLRPLATYQSLRLHRWWSCQM